MMSLIMVAVTLTTMFDDRFVDLPLRPLLILLSTVAAIVGLGVAVFGRDALMVGWVGMTWVMYYGLRGLNWLLQGNISGMVATLPALLLGAVVFVRRRQAPERRGHEGRPS